MKKLLIIVLIQFPFLLQAQKYINIKGDVKGVKEGTIVSLSDANSPRDTFARGVVKKGVFVLKGSLREPLLVALNFIDARKKTVFFLDNSNITVSGSIDDVQKLRVKGSSSQKDFEEFQATFNPLFEKYSKANQAMQQRGSSDSLLKQSKEAYEAIQSKTDAFIANHKKSPVSPFLLMVTSQLSDDAAKLESRFNQLDSSIKGGMFGKMLRTNIDDSKVGAIGTPAIEFTQSDTTGKPVSLSSFKGKYVLIDFWASWCGPCRMENPNVVTAYQKFKDKNFTVLGISLDKPTGKGNWIKAINDDKLTWTHVSDLKFWSNEVALKYRVSSIPQNYLLDPNGIIIGKNLRGEALQSKLCEVLGGCN
jgi:peroxiredoxin